MPCLKDARKIITTSIPNIEGSVVELWDDLSVGDSDKIEDLRKLSKHDAGIKVLCILIKSWNLEDEVTLEGLKTLPIDSFKHLLLATSFGQRLEKSDDELEEEIIEKKQTQTWIQRSRVISFSL